MDVTLKLAERSQVFSGAEAPKADEQYLYSVLSTAAGATAAETSGKIPWGSWSDYEHVTMGKRTGLLPFPGVGC